MAVSGGEVATSSRSSSAETQASFCTSSAETVTSSRTSSAETETISHSRVTIGKLIGRGGFSKVHACMIDGRRKAVVLMGTEPAKEVCAHAELHSRLVHRNIVAFYGLTTCDDSSQYPWQLCEYMEEGSLRDKHRENLKAGITPLYGLTDREYTTVLVDQLAQVAAGLDHLHSKRLAHRDIKADNILLSDGGSRLAISDFGLARLVPDDRDGRSMTAETGTYRWMAPEVIRHEWYDEACDVYSFAILAWECLTYDVPFRPEGLNEIQAAFGVAKNGQRPTIPSHCPRAIAILISSCWHQVAAERPAISEVCKALQLKELIYAHACTAMDAPRCPDKENAPAQATCSPSRSPNLSRRGGASLRASIRGQRCGHELQATSSMARVSRLQPVCCASLK